MPVQVLLSRPAVGLEQGQRPGDCLQVSPSAAQGSGVYRRSNLPSCWAGSKPTLPKPCNNSGWHGKRRGRKDWKENKRAWLSNRPALRICTPEDLVVVKAFANRPRDWSDVEGILLRQKRTLDLTYMSDQLRTLAPAKPEEAILEKLHQVIQAQSD